MAQFSPLQKFAAYATHAFTASGMVAGFYAILFIAEHDFVAAWYCFIAAQVIDGIDGTFARLFKVREVLPHMDGKMMDYVVDFANYAVIPAYFIYEAGYQVGNEYVHILPEDWRWLAIGMMLIVSVLYYGKEGMVSEDMLFVGFPVMWNAVAFYFFFVFFLSPWVNFGIIIFLCIAHFLPLKFPYPSRPGGLFIPNLVAVALGMYANISILIVADRGEDWPLARVLSAIALGWFAVAMIYHTFIEKKKPTNS
ncbi:MAG: hypothetical protein AAF570_02955 [Bacteroidota bacterium]